jgi:hypothetical protein
VFSRVRFFVFAFPWHSFVFISSFRFRSSSLFRFRFPLAHFRFRFHHFVFVFNISFSFSFSISASHVILTIPRGVPWSWRSGWPDNVLSYVRRSLSTVVVYAGGHAVRDHGFRSRWDAMCPPAFCQVEWSTSMPHANLLPTTCGAAAFSTSFCKTLFGIA